MNLVSSNLRGIGGGLKQTSIKSLLDIFSPVVVFLQETMTSRERSCDFFLHLRPSWRVCVQDVVGHSG